MKLIFEIIPTCHTENIDQCVNKSINKSELVRVVPPKQKRYNNEFYSNNLFLPFIHMNITKSRCGDDGSNNHLGTTLSSMPILIIIFQIYNLSPPPRSAVQ